MDNLIDGGGTARNRWILISILCATAILFIVQGFSFLNARSPYTSERELLRSAGMLSIALGAIAIVVLFGALKDSKGGYILGDILGCFIVFDSLLASEYLLKVFGLLLGFTILHYSDRLRKSAKVRELVKMGVITK